VLSAVNEQHRLGRSQADINSTRECVVCIQAKATRAPKRKEAHIQYAPSDVMDVWVADLAGPMTTVDDDSGGRPRCPTMGGHLYALVVVDGRTRMVFVRLLARKQDAARALKELIRMEQLATGRVLVRFHTDGGGEFIGSEFRDWLTEQGTRITQTTASTPEHNAIAERMIKSLFEIVRCLLIQSRAPECLWGEALHWAAHLYNSTPHPKAGGVAPYKAYRNHVTNPHKLRVWGCDAFVQKLPHQQTKLGARNRPGIFVGFDPRTSSFRVLDPETGRVFNSHDVKFMEKSFTHMEAFKTQREDVASDALVGARVPDEPRDRNRDTQDESLAVETARTTETSSAESADEDDGESQDSTLLNERDADSEPMTDASVEHEGAGSVSQPIQIDENDDNSRAAEVFDAAESELSIEADEHAPVPAGNESEVDGAPGTAARLSREARALAQDNSRFGRWNNADEGRLSDRTSRYGRPLLAAPGSIASDLNAYDPSETEQVLSERMHFFVELDDGEDALLHEFEALLLTAEPSTYKQAMDSAESIEWRRAMSEEIDSLNKLGVFERVRCPEGVKPLKGKWVYKNKLGDQNQLLRRKARFVAKGFLQVHGRDYFDTHSPVSKMKSIKVVLSLAARNGLELHQMDFDTAFLNADVEEDIYMEEPEGFSSSSSGSGRIVWKLRKALYGLKQASRQWNRTIDGTLRKLGFSPLVSDPCVYKKISKTKKLMLLCLYVDDTMVGFDVTDLHEWNHDKAAIAQAYPIKDLGECEWVLNMKIIRDRKRRIITLSQKAYVDRMVTELMGAEAHPIHTPLLPGTWWLPAPGEDSSPLPTMLGERYRSAVGALLYAANVTRPDIAYAVGRLCRRTANPDKQHMQGCKRVLRYLKGSAHLGLLFGSQQDHSTSLNDAPLVEIFVDADYAQDPVDSKSTTGYVVRFNGDVINWSSKKQSVVATSSTQAEYMALAEAVKEALWYREWVREVFGVWICVVIHCDNQAAIKLSDNDMAHERTKHIRVRYHFIRDEVRLGTVKIQYVNTAEQQADILTKAMDRVPFARLRDMLMKST